jgi:hypothetical protein
LLALSFSSILLHILFEQYLARILLEQYLARILRQRVSWFPPQNYTNKMRVADFFKNIFKKLSYLSCTSFYPFILFLTKFTHSHSYPLNLLSQITIQMTSANTNNIINKNIIIIPNIRARKTHGVLPKKDPQTRYQLASFFRSGTQMGHQNSGSKLL